MKFAPYFLLLAVVAMFTYGIYESIYGPDVVPSVRQEEEAEEVEMPDNSEEPNRDEYKDEAIFEVTFQASNSKEDAVADIIWLKQAAKVALRNGSPYFHVVHRSIKKKFNRPVGERLNHVEGIIELDFDPMLAEYDAHEINALVLNDFPN